jgi:hypothetical protein
MGVGLHHSRQVSEAHVKTTIPGRRIGATARLQGTHGNTHHASLSIGGTGAAHHLAPLGTSSNGQVAGIGGHLSGAKSYKTTRPHTQTNRRFTQRSGNSLSQNGMKPQHKPTG